MVTSRKATKTATERRKYPVGYDWKKERRLERMREREEAKREAALLNAKETDSGKETS